jgi:hypothetical protein
MTVTGKSNRQSDLRAFIAELRELATSDAFRDKVRTKFKL